MQLAPVAAPPPLAAVAAAAPAACPASVAVLAATVDGLLRLLPFDGTPARAFAIQVEQGGQPHQLTQPCAALCSLPGGGGLLLAQHSSGRLLFCPPLDNLDGSSAADLFMFGTHEAPVTAIAASPCGRLALTGDACGSVKLWDLADGTLLSTAAASAPGVAIAAACLSAGGAAVTLQERSSVVQVWSTNGSRLSLLGELDAAGSGSSCTVTALAASGPLLALGCSDGSTQVWRRRGSEFEPHTRVPAPCGSTAAIRCLALSSADAAAALVAVAAGPALAVVDTAGGTVLAERQLAAAPTALYWSSSGELHALLPESCRLQRLGAPEPSAGAAAQPAATAVAAASPRKKAVRFADQQGCSSAAGARGGSTAERAGSPQPCRASSTPASLAAAVPLSALSAHSNLPPLPSHPLLRGSSAGSARLASTFVPGTSGTSGTSSRSGSGGSSSTCSTRVPTAAPLRPRPSYPVLDLRALQGLRPAAAQVGGSAATTVSDEAACSASLSVTAHRRQAADEQQAAGVSGELRSPLRRAAAPVALPAAGVSPVSSLQHTDTPAGAMPPSAVSVNTEQQVTEPSCSKQAAAQAPPRQPTGDDETPQPRRLPPPLQLRRPPPSPPLPQPAGVSKQRCDACTVLAEAAAPGSRTTSPAKTQLLAQLSQLAGEAAALPQSAQGAVGGRGSRCSSRPVSPVKPGVLCTRQAQRAGELLPAEVRPFTVVEHDTSLAHSEFRQQRYARISRRCTSGRQQAAVAALPAAEPAGQQQADAAQQAAASALCAAGVGMEAAANGAAQSHGVVEQQAVLPASPAAAMQAAVPPQATAAQQSAGWAQPDNVEPAAVQESNRADASSTAAQADSQQGGPAALPEPLGPGAACPAAGSPSPLVAAADQWAQLQASGFAVASDDELTDGEAEEGEAPSSSHGSLSDAAAVRPRHPASQQQARPPVARKPTNHSSASLEGIRSMLQQLDCRLRSSAADAGERQVGVVAPHPAVRPLPAQPACNAEPAVAVPASLLAVPAPNASLLAAHRRQQVEQQAAAAVAVPLVAEARAEAQRRAATAAATVPQCARLYSALPPPVTAAANTWPLSSHKAAALAGATKQVDAGWAAEQQELRPALHDLWAQPVPELHRLSALPVPLAVPLPHARQLAFGFLGLTT